MNRLDQIQKKKPLRVSYVIPGYPTYKESLYRAKILLDLGVDILEIGVPFSDPVADGPIIRTASEKAIVNGITLVECIAFCSTLRDYGPSTALVLMSYLNPLVQFGLDNLNHQLKGVIDGVIIPDCPLEECGPLFQQLPDLYVIQLVSLNTSRDRLSQIVNAAQGFIYLVAVRGTTGGKTPEMESLVPIVQHLKSLTSLPILAGFGIKSNQQIERMTQICDGYIIASEIIEAFDEGRLSDIEDLLTV